MKTLITVLMALTLMSCGEEGANDKSLFSAWSNADTGFVLDMSSSSFGSSSMVWFITGGATCTSTITMGGTESQGSAVVSNTVYSGGGSGDPGCASISGTVTFTKTSDTLTICNSGTCKDYN